MKSHGQKWAGQWKLAEPGILGKTFLIVIGHQCEISEVEVVAPFQCAFIKFANA